MKRRTMDSKHQAVEKEASKSIRRLIRRGQIHGKTEIERGGDGGSGGESNGTGRGGNDGMQ